MFIKCSNKECGHEWDYKGKRKFTTNCPSCMAKVKIKEIEKPKIVDISNKMMGIR